MELSLDVTERNYFISGSPATTSSSKGFHDVKIMIMQSLDIYCIAYRLYSEANIFEFIRPTQ